MQIRPISPPEHGELLALVDDELRPAGAVTRAVEDYPVALDLANQEDLWVLEEGGEIAACLACLVRPFVTSLGELQVAAIGSVVTRPKWRGQGLSSRLQGEVLTQLRERQVTLAVLWSDHPEWYLGRGFEPAGVEYHLDLAHWQPSSPDGRDILDARVRSFRADDISAVGRLYRCHQYHTRRSELDDRRLYNMRGTRGLVLADRQDNVLAYAFCGKGADFPAYVHEWGGEPWQVAVLLQRLHAISAVHRVLVPQGAESLLARLTHEGCSWFSHCCGLWCVLNSSLLLERAAERLPNENFSIPENPQSAVTWLGCVDNGGHVVTGPCQLAIWGFDSV